MMMTPKTPFKINLLTPLIKMPKTPTPLRKTDVTISLKLPAGTAITPIRASQISSAALRVWKSLSGKIEPLAASPKTVLEIDQFMHGLVALYKEHNVMVAYGVDPLSTWTYMTVGIETMDMARLNDAPYLAQLAEHHVQPEVRGLARRLLRQLRDIQARDEARSRLVATLHARRAEKERMPRLRMPEWLK